MNDVRKKAQEALTELLEDKEYYTDLTNELSYEKQGLEEQKNQLTTEKEVLEADRSRLEEDRRDLKREKQLYSMGFYASFATALVSLIGLAVRYPLNKLDRELRELELLERQHELREKKILRDSEEG